MGLFISQYGWTDIYEIFTTWIECLYKYSLNKYIYNLKMIQNYIWKPWSNQKVVMELGHGTDGVQGNNCKASNIIQYYKTIVK